MRAGPAIAAIVVLALLPAQGRAQEALSSSARASDAGAESQALRRSPPPGGGVNDRIQRWVEKLRPLQDRLVKDDRLRPAESVVGLAVAAYEAGRRHSGLPLGAIGAEALRLGLHHQLAIVREQSGFVVEPSIGERSFALTFRKTLD
jgi:hypothetical protein